MLQAAVLFGTNANMRVPRFSIAALMAFIALCGVTFSTLHAVTEFSASAMLTLAIAVSGGALLGRLCTRGTAKATCTGCDRRLWHSALSLWLGPFGMLLAHYLHDPRRNT
jgi:hypothetical protein